MPYLLVRHKVEDYDRWKLGFDEHGSTRKESGSKGGYLFRSAEDPNDVIALLEWDNLDHAREFTHSDELRKKMEALGVTDKPDIYFLDEADRPSE